MPTLGHNDAAGGQRGSSWGQMQRAFFISECGWGGNLNYPGAWPPESGSRKGQNGWETCLLWSINPNSSGSLLGIPLHWACIQRVPVTYLLVQNTHSQYTVPWVPEEQARGQVILNPASSQLLACWLVLKGQRSPSSVAGWFTLDIILRQMLLFLCFVITLDLGSVGGWGKSVLKAGCSCPVP